MSKATIICIAICLFVSCTRRVSDNAYELVHKDSKSFELDERTYYFSKAVFAFKD